MFFVMFLNVGSHGITANGQCLAKADFQHFAFLSVRSYQKAANYPKALSAAFAKLLLAAVRMFFFRNKHFLDFFFFLR
jgi:hypothetical protein